MSATTTKPLFKRGSQNDLIYRRLKSARGAEVPMPVLAEVSGSYAVATRVSNINAALESQYSEASADSPEWFKLEWVENRTERRPDGTKVSFYRLMS